MSSIPLTSPSDHISTNPPTNINTTNQNSYILPENSPTPSVNIKNPHTSPKSYMTTTPLTNLQVKNESSLPPFPPLAHINPLASPSNSFINNTLPQPINGVLPRPPMPFQAHFQLVTSALMLLNNFEKNNAEFAQVYAHHMDLIKQAKTPAELEKYYFLIFGLKYLEQHKEENILPELVSKLTFMANNIDTKLPDSIDITGGVVFDEFWGSGNVDSGRPLGRWVACWEHQGRYFRRGFSVALFGYNGARELAESYWIERKRAIQLSAHNMSIEPSKIKKIKLQAKIPKQQRVSEDSGDLLKFDQTNGKWCFESLEGKQCFNTQQEAIEAFRSMRIKVLKNYTESQMLGVNFEKNRLCWCVSHWVPSKQVRRNRYFNVNKYGWERAKSLAIIYKQLVDKMDGEEPSDKLLFEQVGKVDTLPSFIIAILEEIRYKPMSLSEDRRMDKLNSSLSSNTNTNTTTTPDNAPDDIHRQSTIDSQPNQFTGITTNSIHPTYVPEYQMTSRDSVTPIGSPIISQSNPQIPSQQIPSQQIPSQQIPSQQIPSQQIPSQSQYKPMYIPYQQQLHSQHHQNSQYTNMNTKSVSPNMGPIGKPNIKFIQQGSLPHEGEWEVTWTYGGNEMNRKFSTYHMGPEDAKNMAFIFLSQLQSQHPQNLNIHYPQ